MKAILLIALCTALTTQAMEYERPTRAQHAWCAARLTPTQQTLLRQFFTQRNVQVRGAQASEVTHEKEEVEMEIQVE